MNKRQVQAVIELAVVLGYLQSWRSGQAARVRPRWSPCLSRSWCIVGSARSGMLATPPQMVRKTSLQHSMYILARCSATSFGLIINNAQNLTSFGLAWNFRTIQVHSAFFLMPVLPASQRERNKQPVLLVRPCCLRACVRDPAAPHFA